MGYWDFFEDIDCNIDLNFERITLTNMTKYGTVYGLQNIKFYVEFFNKLKDIKNNKFKFIIKLYNYVDDKVVMLFDMAPEMLNPIPNVFRVNKKDKSDKMRMYKKLGNF